MNSFFNFGSLAFRVARIVYINTTGNSVMCFLFILSICYCLYEYCLTYVGTLLLISAYTSRSNLDTLFIVSYIFFGNSHKGFSFRYNSSVFYQVLCLGKLIKNFQRTAILRFESIIEKTMGYNKNKNVYRARVTKLIEIPKNQIVAFVHYRMFLI